MPDDDTKFVVGTPYSMAKARLNYGDVFTPLRVQSLVVVRPRRSIVEGFVRTESRL